MGVVDAEFMPDAEPKAMNVSDSLLMSMSMSVAHYNPRTLPSPQDIYRIWPHYELAVMFMQICPHLALYNLR